MSFFFFFNAPATTEIYTLSLHDALPISPADRRTRKACDPSPSPTGFPSSAAGRRTSGTDAAIETARSEEHTSELQSRVDLVCRLLLEKKKKKKKNKKKDR